MSFLRNYFSEVCKSLANRENAFHNEKSFAAMWGFSWGCNAEKFVIF